MDRKINLRPGVEVFINTNNMVTIKQEPEDTGYDLVVLHPEDIPQLIEHLQSLHEEWQEVHGPLSADF